MEPDLPCTEKCRSVQHGNLISAIARYGNSEQIVTLWSKTCTNYGHIKDCYGRSALHMIASTSNDKALEWLLEHEGCNINAKEASSGYTPLHRSIYFGQIHIARLLIENGANIHATDNEALTPLDLYLLDRKNLVTSSGTSGDPTEIYIWGTNTNYNLGTGTWSVRNTPEPLDVFGDSNISQVVLQSYHSIFLSQTGEVFTCGFGTGGRLGLRNEMTCLKPTLVENITCKYVTAGSDHTLFLSETGHVYGCGSNENHVLGIKNSKTSKALKVERISAVDGVCTSDFHTVFHTQNRVFTCGRNFGQLGHPLVASEKPGSPVVYPKKIACNPYFFTDDYSAFDHVVCNDVATVLCTGQNIYLLYNFDFARIRIQQLKSSEIEKICVVGGNLLPEIATIKDSMNHSYSISEAKGRHTFKNNLGTKDSTSSDNNFSPLTLIILTKEGVMIVWRELQKPSPQPINFESIPTSPKKMEGVFSKLYYNIGRSLTITDFSVNRSCILVTTSNGEAFQGHWNCIESPNVFKNINEPLKNGPVVPTSDRWGICRYKKRGGDQPESNITCMALECVKLKRIPNIYSAIWITCDPKSKTFAVIQRHQRSDYITLPTTSNSVMNQNLQTLYKEASLDDNLHDVVFEVTSENETKKLFPAHKFIIANLCPALYKEIANAESESSTRPVVVQISNTNQLVFDQILQYIYCADCPIINKEIIGKFDETELIKLIRETMTCARKLDLRPLWDVLNMIYDTPGDGLLAKPPNYHMANFRFRQRFFLVESFKNLSDLTLQTCDNKEINVHRCMLFARLEHYQALSSHEWSETKSNIWKVPTSYYGTIYLLEYVYSDRIRTLESMESNHGISNGTPDEKITVVDKAIEALSTSDYFFFNEFRTQAELLLYEMIRLKNVAKILTTAVLFNAPQLKDACFHFIALNLGPLLENRLLDELSSDIMMDLSKFYQNLHPCMNQRLLKADPILTPNEDEYNQALQSVLPEFDLFVNNHDEYVVTCQQKSSSSGTGGKGGGTWKTQHKRHTSRSNNSECEDITERVSPPMLPLTSSEVLPPVTQAYGRNIGTNTNGEAEFNVVSRARKGSHEKPQIRAPYQIPITKSIPVSSASSSDTNSVNRKSNEVLPTGFKTLNTTQPKVNTPRTPAVRISNSLEEFPTLGTDLTATSTQNQYRNSNDVVKLEARHQNKLTAPSAKTIAGSNDAAESKPTSHSGKPLVRNQSDPMDSKPSASVTYSSNYKKKTKWVSLEDSHVPKKSVPTSSPISVNPDRDPSNPWTKITGVHDDKFKSTNNGAESNVKNQKVNFEDIIKDEKEKEENWKKVTSKSLRLMQIEDLAMDQLLRRYTNDDTLNGIQMLTVERLSVTNVGQPPSWPHQSLSASSPSTSGNAFTNKPSTSSK